MQAHWKILNFIREEREPFPSCVYWKRQQQADEVPGNVQKIRNFRCLNESAKMRDVSRNFCGPEKMSWYKITTKRRKFQKMGEKRFCKETRLSFRDPDWVLSHFRVPISRNVLLKSVFETGELEQEKNTSISCPNWREQLSNYFSRQKPDEMKGENSGKVQGPSTNYDSADTIDLAVFSATPS